MRPRFQPILLPAIFLILAAVGCKVTADDLETWKGTVKGPGKIVAVMLSDKYPLELRSRAALALVEMDHPDVDGVAELQSALGRLDEQTRSQVIEGVVPGVIAAMRGSDTAQPTGEAAGPSPSQARAKDAGYLLIRDASGAAQQQLGDAVVGWYVVDFNGRNLAGKYSAEQVVRALGTPAAAKLVDGMQAQMPAPALVKVAELISELGDDETKARAAARLLEIEQQVDSDDFLNGLKQRLQEQVRRTNPDVEIDEARLQSAAILNRESAMNDGLLPAMKHLSDQAPVAARLLAIAANGENGADRRRGALQALEGRVGEAQLDQLLSLALDTNNPPPVQDYAFDRVGDIRSAAAIPRLWPLVESGDDQRRRWRAGEMVLAIGGSQIVDEFFTRLPGGADTVYEPEELAGYAGRMSQMRPAPTDHVRAQFRSANWWNRVIALRFFERKGTQADAAAMRRLVRDDAQTKGRHWGEELNTVGKVAENAIQELEARLASGGEAEQGEGAEAPAAE